MKTGDTVKHGPTGETWTLAYAEYSPYGNRVSWCGWPCGEARMEDCTLIEECSEEESLALLRKLADMRGDERTGYDRRKSYAQEELRRRGLLPALPPTDAQKVQLLLEAVRRQYDENAPRTESGAIVPPHDFAAMSESEREKWDFPARDRMHGLACLIAAVAPRSEPSAAGEGRP